MSVCHKLFRLALAYFVYVQIYKNLCTLASFR